eukprot:3934461-Rhodomonas_salina.1
MLLRTCYAMSGTDIGYAATRPMGSVLPPPPGDPLCAYGLLRDVRYRDSLLRCAVPPYDSATRCPVLTQHMLLPDAIIRLRFISCWPTQRPTTRYTGAFKTYSRYRATRSLVLTYTCLPSSYACAMPCPVLPYATKLLRVRYAVSSTERAYAPTRRCCARGGSARRATRGESARSFDGELGAGVGA